MTDFSSCCNSADIGWFKISVLHRNKVNLGLQKTVTDESYANMKKREIVYRLGEFEAEYGFS